MSYAVVDLETTTKAYKKRLGSPFHPDNWIVMMGWCTRSEPRPQGQRYMQHRQGDVDRDFINILRTPGLRWVVGHNVKFDILHLINGSTDVLEEWQKFVAGGGRVFCTQLAEYLLDGHDQQSHMLSLNELSARHGLDSKVDEVKELWAAGVDTPDIEPALLARYLLGEDLPNGLRREGDIGITRGHFLRQCEAIKGQNMTRLIALEMGALTASIEMERNGMFVDRVLGAKLAAELAAELDEAKQELEQYLPADLPFTFNWSNRYHLSPAIFGGAVKYPRKQYDLKDGTSTFIPPDVAESEYRKWWNLYGQGRNDPNGKPVPKPPAVGGAKAYAYAQKDTTHYVLEDGTTMECLWWEHCYNTEHGFADSENMTRVQFKAGKNAGEYKTKKVKTDDYDKPKCRMVDDFWKFNGVATPRKEWASATPGLYSVGADVIKDLTEHTTIPFLKTLGRVTSISKDLGTYFISEDGEKGMLTLVGDDGVVHHSVNHTNTVTGRLSGSNPNLQNIPKGNKSKAKQVFVSRFPAGYIVASDFSSLEVYVQANQTKCVNLLADLRAGIDLHCVRLAAKENKPYEEVLKLCKGYKETAPDGTVIEHAAVPEWDYKRTGAKGFSFQRAYGAGIPAIAKSTGMSIEDVEALAAAEDLRYPEIGLYFDELGDRINECSVPTSTFVPHPDNPAVRCQLRISRVREVDGGILTFRSSPAPKFMLKRGVTSTFSPTERKNYPVQRMGAQIMKAAMYLMVVELYRRGNFDGEVLLVNTVHDAQYVDASPNYFTEGAALLHACMSVATAYHKHWHGTDWTVMVPSETTFGPSMAIEKNVPPEVLALANEYATEIAAAHNFTI